MHTITYTYINIYRQYIYICTVYTPIDQITSTFHPGLTILKIHPKARATSASPCKAAWCNGVVPGGEVSAVITAAWLGIPNRITYWTGSWWYEFLRNLLILPSPQTKENQEHWFWINGCDIDQLPKDLHQANLEHPRVIHHSFGPRLKKHPPWESWALMSAPLSNKKRPVSAWA